MGASKATRSLTQAHFAEGGQENSTKRPNVVEPEKIRGCVNLLAVSTLTLLDVANQQRERILLRVTGKNRLTPFLTHPQL